MNVPIETDRLTLHPFRSDDVRVPFDWFGDPVVVRFTPNGQLAAIALGATS